MLWHYTIGRCLVQILRDGYIRPARAGVPAGERPIVWFSQHRDWEPTACKDVRGPDGTRRTLTKEEMQEMDALIRIGVERETAPHDWRALKQLSGMSPKMAQGLQRSALQQGARPGDWRGTFENVPQAEWLAVEVLLDERWQSFPAADTASRGALAPEMEEPRG